MVAWQDGRAEPRITVGTSGGPGSGAGSTPAKANRHEAELSQRRKTLVELQQKKQRVLKAQIRRAQARITNAERKRRTHRLVLLGSYLNHCMQTDTESEPRVMKGLDEFLTRNQDRAVFNLQPKETAK